MGSDQAKSLMIYYFHPVLGAFCFRNTFSPLKATLRMARATEGILLKDGRWFVSFPK